MEADRPGGFLPPEPAGPEPELGARPARAPDPPPPQQPPPGYPPQYQYQQPPPGWQAPPAGAWGWAPRPAEPDNGPAVAGFVLSMVAGGLLLVTGGLSSIISIGCAIAGIVQSRQGKRKVAAGETGKHAGLAQAGFIVGIISLVVSVLATIGWTLVIVLLATDEGFREDFENDTDGGSNLITAALRVATVGARAILG
ncbi:MAG TPA: hypothetical protein VFQ12_11095 [Thermoleophilaceae bacterium]|nr:hypothetical protein [Thermoleophilaceae bacterium]